MNDWQLIGLAVCILLTVSCLVVLVWLCAVVADLRQMVEIHEDRFLPPFAPEADEPEFEGETQEFVGSSGITHKFQFKGDQE